TPDTSTISPLPVPTPTRAGPGRIESWPGHPGRGGDDPLTAPLAHADHARAPVSDRQRERRCGGDGGVSRPHWRNRMVSTSSSSSASPRVTTGTLANRRNDCRTALP